MAKNDKDQDKPKSTSIEGSEPPWAKKEPEEPEDDGEEAEEDEEDDDDDDDAPAKKPAASKASTKDEDEDDDDDGDEDDDDDDDDEEDERPARSTKPVEKGARPAERARPSVRKPASTKPMRKAEPLPDDGLPSWLPWAVMVGLISLGVMGAFGVFSKKPSDASAADVPATTASDSEPDSISAQHLLVAFKGATRAAPTVERTKEQAKARAEEALKKAKAGEDFAKLVGEYSDEPGAAERKGNLGKFGKNAMVKPFADAAFKLKPGEIASSVVETQFGFHVIKRTE